MKLKFKYQHFQAEAVRAVTDVFRGQQNNQVVGNLYSARQHVNTGAGNGPLTIDQNLLLQNIRTVQQRQELELTEQLKGEELHLTVEMETGTGKTYTYLKTMFELNRLYQWTKFMIVVPNVAVREGVCKSFEMMQDHFTAEYGKRMQFFVYNSLHPAFLEQFANTTGMHVMLINMQAFSVRGMDARRIYMQLDSCCSRRPIELIQETRPILIIDEPQSVLGASKRNITRERLREFCPLFTLLYSATHRKSDRYNMVFQLGSLDAYTQKLVKKVCVKGIERVGCTTASGYLYLERIVVGQGITKARIEFNAMTPKGVTRVRKFVGCGFDVNKQSGYLREYPAHCLIENMDGMTGTVTLRNGWTLHEGDVLGDIHEDLLRRIQIRETIISHIEREEKLFYRGIKVLSLFFIDQVENYRQYRSDGVGAGKYARMFEEEYDLVLNGMTANIRNQEYVRYLKRLPASAIHQGYFSRDKNGCFVNSSSGKDASVSRDHTAYNLIMRNKERLLSLDEPVRFLFSHSTLKEGWDNPNVFQICALKRTDNELKKHQEIGRGMRLCVNQYGERQDVDALGKDFFDVNVLTVIANESYTAFSEKLQTEMVEYVGNSPDKITASSPEGNILRPLDARRMRGTPVVSVTEMEAIAASKQIYTPPFSAVNVDTSDWLERTIQTIDGKLDVTGMHFVVHRGTLQSADGALYNRFSSKTDHNCRTVHVSTMGLGKRKYDLIGQLAAATLLTRGLVVRILQGVRPETFQQFKMNPDLFIVEVAKLINEQKTTCLQKHITET